MSLRGTDVERGHRRGGGRTGVRLDAAALRERPALLNPSRNRFAKEIGISPGHTSMSANNEERSPSGRIRRRMQKALGTTNTKTFTTWRIAMNDTNHIDRLSGMEPLGGTVLPKDFPKRLERLKEASGLTWRGVARVIGIDHKLLLYWRRGAAPSGGSMLSLFRFANRVPGGLRVLLGEELQMTFFRN